MCIRDRLFRPTNSAAPSRGVRLRRSRARGGQGLQAPGRSRGDTALLADWIGSEFFRDSSGF
eukprot:6398145-Alexandrium_andersonii.AAC.1